ncbi:hypothetical protein Bca4012_020973 [Brassica carinata]
MAPDRPIVAAPGKGKAIWGSPSVECQGGSDRSMGSARLNCDRIRDAEGPLGDGDCSAGGDCEADGGFEDGSAAKRVGRGGGAAIDGVLGRRVTPFVYRLAHPTTFKFPEPFWIDVPKIAVLTEQQWESFNQQRIDRQRERIAKGDWASTVPCEETKGKRLKLPLMGVIPKAYPSYGAMLRAQLGGGSYESMLASEGQEVEIRGSPSVRRTIDDGDTEVQGTLAEDTGVAVSDPSMGESSEQTKKKKRKKKRDKSLNEVTTDPGDGGGLAEGEPVMDDRSVNRTMDPKDPAEEGRADTSIAKRKEAPSEGPLSSGGKKLKESGDSFSRSAGEIALPASRLLPWGGSNPPSEKLASASSERWTFCHDKDVPFVSDSTACAELMRLIRGGTHLIPEIPGLAFPDRFVESARADVEAIFRKNQLISEYELALRRMASDFARAEATIEIKDLEIEKLKKAAIEKSKEIVNERTRYFRERTQAKQTADDLEEELETARSKIARLDAEVKTAQRTMDFMRQAHRRDLVSHTSCISTAATDRFDKFRRYMADRDKREEKLILHSEASGTLGSMDVLKDLGMPIPKELIDTLTTNEANFRREMEEITVEVISEQDLVIPRFPGLEACLSLNRANSSLGDADPIDASVPRSSAPAGEPPAAQGAPIGNQEGVGNDGTSDAPSLDPIAED